MKLKKLLTGLFFVGMVLSLSAREIDAMKSLARELLKDVLRSENKTVIVGGFESNVGRAETSQLEDALQIAMYDTGKVEILDVYNLDEDLEGVDYICTGTISNGRSAYNMTVKLLDAETKKMVGVALKEIPKALIVGGTLNQVFSIALETAMSVEPIPVANAPSAPEVHVWESAPTNISPGLT